jgi:hypothetical protein
MVNIKLLEAERSFHFVKKEQKKDTPKLN